MTATICDNRSSVRGGKINFGNRRVSFSRCGSEIVLIIEAVTVALIVI